MERYDFNSEPPRLPHAMTWAEMQARAKREGVWDDLLKAGVFAGMAGADAALADVPLPPWAQDVIRAQFPAH